MSLRLVSRHPSRALRSALASSSRSYRGDRNPYDLEDDDEPSSSSSPYRSTDRNMDIEPTRGQSSDTGGTAGVGIARKNPNGNAALLWNRPDVRPDVDHPSYKPSEIMDFRDESAKLPPALAVQRQDKLRRARAEGVHHTQLNSRGSKAKLPPPIVPVRMQGRPKDEKVQYQVGQTGETNERRAYYEDRLDVGEGGAVSEAAGFVSQMDWEGDEGEMPELETGRIVEMRRSGQSSVGMILSALVVSGRQRLLVLRSNGEIWPIAVNDVQYVMPSSLINPAVADACWSPELVSLWAEGEEAASPELAEAVKPMQEARRKAVMIIRKVTRETERMCGKMLGDIGRSQFGGIEGVWDKLAPREGSSTITATEVAEYMLNAHGPATRITVKPNTLPAYAAHCLMMNRADLFLADQISVAKTGTFEVRSRAFREDLQRTTRLLNSQAVEDQAVVAGFIEKAKRVVTIMREARENEVEGEFTEVKHDLPEWTEEERLILSMLVNRLYETRTIQVSEAEAFATNIMRSTGVYGEAVVDRSMVPQFLTDLGVIAPWDTLKRSEVRELARRGEEMSRVKPAAEGLLQGNELDELRHDFTAQKVFVVDDVSASELDDGISVERVPGSDDVWIHVHVADPTRFIPLNSAIATSASFQGSSAYLPEGNVPLLNLEAVMKELSLGAEFSRDEGRQGTMTFSTKLSARGETLDYKVRMGWIYKPKVVTYDSVNTALGVQGREIFRPLGTPLGLRSQPKANIQIAAEDLEDLRLIQKMAQAYRDTRLAHAGLEWEYGDSSLRVLNDTPEISTNIFKTSLLPARPSLYVGSPKFDLTLSPVPKTWSGLPATAIISEMMIMSGRTAGRFLTDRNLAGPFRLSSAPRPYQLPGQKKYTVDELLAMRDPVSHTLDASVIAAANVSMAAGDTSMSAGHHWIMGITDDAGYVRATSPLRRFDDLLVHWQIKAALASEKGMGGALAQKISAEDMSRYVSRSDPIQRRMKRMEITAREWWQAGMVISRLRNPKPDGYEYGSNSIDPVGPLQAVIMGQTAFSMSSASNKNSTPVRIPALGLNARMPGRGKAEYQIGQEVQVKLRQAIQWPAPMIDVELITS